MCLGLTFEEDGEVNYSPLLVGKTPVEYRSFFESIYCKGPILTFDGISVRFRRRDFNHCFFESITLKDDTFSQIRAERLLWIKEALQDPQSERYVGWYAKKKQYDKNRRVAVVKGNYIVVIGLTGNQKADFITAYVADSQETLAKIKKGPLWT